MVAAPGAARLSGEAKPLLGQRSRHAWLDPGSCPCSPWLVAITRHRIDLLAVAIVRAGSVSTKELEDTLTRRYTLPIGARMFLQVSPVPRHLRLSRHDLDLDGGAERQAGGPNRCPGRIWCLEMKRVNGVHRAEILHIREVDSGLHHIVEGLPCRFQHG